MKHPCKQVTILSAAIHRSGARIGSAQACWVQGSQLVVFRRGKELTAPKGQLLETSCYEDLEGNQLSGIVPMKLIERSKNGLLESNLSVWHNAYLELESQNLTMLEFSAKLSYNLLESEEIQQTFLIYACMGQDALISDLVRYCISLGLLQGIDVVREARDRVHKLVARLKELSLLSESFSTRCFTMQSLIRDAALLIASQNMHVFALTKEKLEKWQDKDKLGSYSTISL
ncbi:hypothetical protein Fmac_023477 [Flemingia macrophylla]|uniref:Uncharacterized protein n=1 Tax=Flemingia macrophylla TaxID=520843 RepID=A0ABD1LLK9_9FABA